MTETRAATADGLVAREIAPWDHYIAGAFRPSADGDRFETLDPAMNVPITSVAAGTATDVDAAVAAARRAFADGDWPHLSPRERASALVRIADAIEDRADDIVALECLDAGVPINQARGQAARAAENFRFFASIARGLTTEALRDGRAFMNYVVRKPIGVTGIITPWNTPFMLETWRVAPALAAGNTVVLKPAEWAPLSANVLAEAIAAAELPRGAFNVVHGIGEVAGAALAAHPDVRLVAFTGETGTGREVMGAGAATLKRHSFELGGKSPVVVFADCDVERAVDAAVFGVFSLNGERCTAGSRLLVERPLYDEFVAAVARRAEQVRIGHPADPRTELGPLIHPAHWERVHGYVREGAREARLVAGGERPGGFDDGNYLQATVFADVHRASRIFQEEIFGPVVTATPFDTDQEALDLANDVRYGLAAYVWTNDLRRAHRMAQGIDSGLVWVNSHNVRDLRAPFGGVKDSGINHEGGRYSFDFYCDTQTVHVALGEHHIPRFGAGEDR